MPRGRAEHLRRDVTLPHVRQHPTRAAQPQATAARRSFAAATHGGFISIAAGCLVKDAVTGEQAQEIRCGLRSRGFSCLAVSSCGKVIAAGEAAAPGSRTSQVVWFHTEAADSSHPGPNSLGLIHRRSIRHVAWMAEGKILAVVAESDPDQAGDREQQLSLLSWPSGERLAVAACGRGMLEMVGSPYAARLCTIGPSGLRVWTASSQDTFLDAPLERPGAAPLSSMRLTSQPLPVMSLSATSRQLQGASASSNGRPRERAYPGRRTSRNDGFYAKERMSRRPADVFVSAVWGEAQSLFLVTRNGVLSHLVQERLEKSLDLGRRAHCLAWISSESGFAQYRTVGCSGLLACALAAGDVQLLDVASLTVVATLACPEMQEVPADATVVSFCPDGTGIFAMYADRSLARWTKELEAAPDYRKPRVVPHLRDLRSAPMRTGVPGEVVTLSDRRLQVWMSGEGGFSIAAQSQPGWRNDLMALAVSSNFIASGSASGEVQLFYYGLDQQLTPMEPLPQRHFGEVTALSFGACNFKSLLLASVSRDGGLMLFRIEEHYRSAESKVTLLFHPPRHSMSIQNVAVLSGGLSDGFHEATAHLALYTSDRQLILREIGLTPNSASVRRAQRHQAPGLSRWVGICAAPTKPALFVASNDRRLLQMEPSGRISLEVRLVGVTAEFASAMRISDDARLLAVGLTGVGILLVDVQSQLTPMSVLVTGQAEVPIGISLLPRHDRNYEVTACWHEGSLLSWHLETELDEAAQSTFLSISQEHTLPSHGEILDAGYLVPALASSESPLSPRHPQPLAALPATPCPKTCEELFRSAPQPPSWSQDRILRQGLEKLRRECVEEKPRASSQPPEGHWARKSIVGGTVLSARHLPVTEGHDGPRFGASGAQVRSVSEGFNAEKLATSSIQVLKLEPRRLFLEPSHRLSMVGKPVPSITCPCPPMASRTASRAPSLMPTSGSKQTPQVDEGVARSVLQILPSPSRSRRGLAFRTWHEELESGQEAGQEAGQEENSKSGQEPFHFWNDAMKSLINEHTPRDLSQATPIAELLRSVSQMVLDNARRCA